MSNPLLLNFKFLLKFLTPSSLITILKTYQLSKFQREFKTYMQLNTIFKSI